MGAVIGDHSFLKLVIKAKMRPPTRPIMIARPATLGSCACMNEFHVHAAVAMAQRSRMPVLLMVPLRDMRAEASMRLPPVWLRAKSLKVFWPSAGLEVLIRGIEVTPFLFY